MGNRSYIVYILQFVDVYVNEVYEECANNNVPRIYENVMHFLCYESNGFKKKYFCKFIELIDKYKHHEQIGNIYLRVFRHNPYTPKDRCYIVKELYKRNVRIEENNYGFEWRMEKLHIKNIMNNKFKYVKIFLELAFRSNGYGTFCLIVYSLEFEKYIMPIYFYENLSKYRPVTNSFERIMGIVKKANWSPSTHQYYPEKAQANIICAKMIHNKIDLLKV